MPTPINTPSFNQHIMTKTERPPYPTPPPCAYCGGSDYNDKRHGWSWSKIIRNGVWVTIHHDCYRKCEDAGWFKAERRFQVAERARITSSERQHKGSGGHQNQSYNGEES